MRGVMTVVLVTMGSAALTQSADPLAPLPQQPAASAPAQVRPQSFPTAPPPRMLQPSAQPAAASRGFEGYKVRLSALARAAGVRPATIAAVVPYLRINDRAI